MDKSIAKRVLEQAVIGILISVFSTLMVSSFFSEKYVVEVFSSIKTKSGDFITAVGVKNFQKNDALLDVGLCILNNINIAQVITDMDHSVDLSRGAVILRFVPPNSTNTLLIYSDSPIYPKSLTVQSDRTLSLSFFSNRLQISIFTIINFVTAILLYGIFFGVLTYFNAKKEQKIEEIWKEKTAQLELRMESINNKSIGLQKQIEDNRLDFDRDYGQIAVHTKTIEKKNKELRIYYLARLKDYRTELNFWKDTLRKFVYQSGQKVMNADDLFNTVTDMLKTYGTKKEVEIYYDEIHYLAEQISKTGRESKLTEVKHE